MAKKHKQTADVNEIARQFVTASTSEFEDGIEHPTKAQISMFMAEMGRKGGKIGGKRRLQTMTAQQRSQNAKLAADARWGNQK